MPAMPETLPNSKMRQILAQEKESQNAICSRQACRMTPMSPSLVFNGIKLVAEEFVHLKHVYPANLEHGLHFVVANDLPLITRVLEFVGLDMFP